MVILSTLVGGTKNALKHFVFDRIMFLTDLYFPKIMFIYKIKGNTNIIK